MYNDQCSIKYYVQKVKRAENGENKSFNTILSIQPF